MNATHYRLSKKAAEDLNEIWLYTKKKWSIKQADIYYQLIIEAIISIVGNFESRKSMDYIKKGYRVSKIKSHLIFYKMGTDNIVEIVRILHQRIDVEKRLTD